MVQVLKGVIAVTALIVMMPLLRVDASGIPCASDYGKCRLLLLKNGWIPVAVTNSYPPFTEVSSGNRIATAKWLNPMRTESTQFVLWWQNKVLCISPQFTSSVD